jgi:plastocyanin/DNA-binding beta-propeller fold protein YncE
MHDDTTIWRLIVKLTVLAAVACAACSPDIEKGQTPVPTEKIAADEFSQPISVVTHAESSIKGLELSAKTIYSAAGADLIWTNDDDVLHNITSRDGWFNADVQPGDSFSWQPESPGVYRYFCRVHESIQGTIVVVPGGAVAPTYFDGKSISRFFADTCGGCHGQDRQGGTGPALIPGRLAEDDEAYFDRIANGKPGTIMPAWSSLGVSNEEIWGLIGYIRSEPSVDSIVWGIEQIRASLAVLQDESSLPDSPDHSGNLDNLMLVTEREQRRIALIDGDTHQLIKHIEASYRAHGYVFDPTSDRWAHNLGRDGWVFKVDLYTGETVRKVRVGHDSRGLAISDDGKYLIAGNYLPHTAVILDAGTLEPLKVFETNGVNPDGKEVSSRVAITSDIAPSLVGPYFLIALKEAGQVWLINYSDSSFPVRKIKNVGRILHDGFLRADNKRFYLASQADDVMVVIDVENAAVVDRIATGDTPHPGSGAVWEAGGKQYGATVHAGEGKVTIWNLVTNEIIGSVPTGGPGLFLRSHDHSPYVWADALFGDPANRITVFEKEPPFSVVGTIADGEMTLHPEFTADGRFVYISDWKGNMIRVYDAEKLTKVAEIQDLVTPTGIFNTERRHEMLGH